MNPVALAALLFASSAAAAPAPGTQANWDKSCDGDAMKFCGDQPVGTGLLLACMKKHETELSPACLASIKTIPSWPCAEDRVKFCGDLMAAKKDPAPCLKQHAAELSPACQPVARAAVKDEVCSADRARLCKPDEKPNDCLKAKKDQLSAACRDRFFPKPAPAKGPGKAPSTK